MDEAYALVPKHDMQGDYGNEAIATLIKAMEDYRGKFCVILAGYKNEMISMLNSNPGFSSRIQFTLDFPNYNRDELSQIAQLMLNKQGYQMPGAALDKILDLTDIKRKQPNFANAREIRNILDQVIMCQNLRARDPQDKNILLHDVDQYFKDSKLKLPKGNNQHILTGQEELDQLVGLETIKKTVMKIAAYASRNKNDDSFNLHMCFSGNPGTGKTEVARILSRIFYDNGVLAEAKMIETDPYGLIGKYVGETAPKTLDKINEAMNGVLFIDEAYGLVGSNTLSGSATNYGAEAITVLIKEMEDHRGQFCVIFAGYKNEMKNLISSNPGLESRIQFSLDFPDYTRSELKQIAILFLTKKGYQIDDEALNMVIDLTDYYRSKPNFANARTLRKILDQVVMNQNLRTKDNDTLITSEDVQDYLNDLDLKLEHSNQ